MRLTTADAPAHEHDSEARLPHVSSGVPAAGAAAPASAADRRARFRRWALAHLAAWGVAGVLLSASLLSPDAKQVLSDTLFVLFPLPGMVFCLVAARATSGRLRRCWGLFAAAEAAWALSNVAWFHKQLVAESQHFPSLFDVAAVVALLAAMAGLALFPTGHKGPGHARLLLDAVLVVLSLFFGFWLLDLQQLVDQADVGAGLWFVSYAMGDLAVASLALLLLTRASRGFRLDLVLVAVGMCAYALSDAAYAVQTLDSSARIGTPADLGWLAGYLLVGLAALTPEAVEEESGTVRAASLHALASVPVYMVTGAALGAAVFSELDHWSDRVLALALIAATSVRHAVLHHDNRALQRGLEDLVAMRTAELDQLSDRHDRLVDTVPDGVIEVDARGVVTFANPAAGRLLGVPHLALLGQPAHAAFHPGHLPAAECPSCAAEACQGLTADEFPRLVVPYRRATSEGDLVFPADVTAAPLRSRTGARLGSVVVFADDTERHAVERLKSEFVSIASHELRTPLTAVRFSLALLEDGEAGALPEPATRLVQLASDAARRLHRLVDDILDLERLDAGEMPLHVTDTEAADLVHSTFGLVQRVADEAGVALVIGDVAGRVRADADRVVQALTNLIHNAVKFSPPGTAVVVEARPDESPDGAMVRFLVRDQGRGIPEDKLDVIFGRFQQLDERDSAEKGGAGLGLSITKSLVERHGGAVTVESRPGQGSTFAFTVPSVPPPDPA